MKKNIQNSKRFWFTTQKPRTRSWLVDIGSSLCRFNLNGIQYYFYWLIADPCEIEAQESAILEYNRLSLCLIQFINTRSSLKWSFRWSISDVVADFLKHISSDLAVLILVLFLFRIDSCCCGIDPYGCKNRRYWRSISEQIIRVLKFLVYFHWSLNNYFCSDLFKCTLKIWRCTFIINFLSNNLIKN